ncbi:MAG: hypothetical protein IH621_05840 [Krumholzibacteria bacterium]|nr:hypothetical protein [Candidatus Krumholzibacteria bacterium]
MLRTAWGLNLRALYDRVHQQADGWTGFGMIAAGFLLQAVSNLPTFTASDRTIEGIYSFAGMCLFAALSWESGHTVNRAIWRRIAVATLRDILAFEGRKVTASNEDFLARAIEAFLPGFTKTQTETIEAYVGRAKGVVRCPQKRVEF